MNAVINTRQNFNRQIFARHFLVDNTLVDNTLVDNTLVDCYELSTSTLVNTILTDTLRGVEGGCPLTALLTGAGGSSPLLDRLRLAPVWLGYFRLIYVNFSRPPF